MRHFRLTTLLGVLLAVLVIACSGPPGPTPIASGSSQASSSSSSCFDAPGACGYPDPAYANVGATSACSSLKSSGSVTANTSGATIENLDITGSLTIDAANVTVENVCISDDGHMTGFGIDIGSGASGTTIEHVTIQSSSSSTSSTFMDTGIWDAGSCASGGGGDDGLSVNYTIVEGAAESIHAPQGCTPAEGATVENSYLQAGYYFVIPDGSDGCTTAGGCPSHNEAIYMSDTSITLDHDTLLNAASQTAVLFGDNDGGNCCVAPDNNWVVENSLIAGGGYTAYWDAKCASSSPCPSAGTGSLDVTDNRWARCTTTPTTNGRCNSASPGDPSFGAAGGADASGYYPNGGYYGGDVYGHCATATWTNNVWDDDDAAVGCD